MPTRWFFAATAAYRLYSLPPQVQTAASTLLVILANSRQPLVFFIRRDNVRYYKGFLTEEDFKVVPHSPVKWYPTLRTKPETLFNHR